MSAVGFDTHWPFPHPEFARLIWPTTNQELRWSFNGSPLDAAAKQARVFHSRSPRTSFRAAQTGSP